MYRFVEGQRLTILCLQFQLGDLHRPRIGEDLCPLQDQADPSEVRHQHEGLREEDLWIRQVTMIGDIPPAQKDIVEIDFHPIRPDTKHDHQVVIIVRPRVALKIRRTTGTERGDGEGIHGVQVDHLGQTLGDSSAQDLPSTPIDTMVNCRGMTGPQIPVVGMIAIRGEGHQDKIPGTEV